MIGMKIINGGVTAAKGYKCASMRVGIKASGSNRDLMLLVSDVPATCVGTFTKNKVKAAPVKWDMNVVYETKKAQAVVVNTGIANAATGEPGLNNCKLTAEAVNEIMGIPTDYVICGSTGVIGPQLPIEKIINGVKELSDKLSERFSNVLVIAGVLTQEEELSKLNCDLLISTMRISSPPSIPTVYVSPFIKEQDLKNVFDSIEAIRAQKKKKEFRERLSYLIKEELFTLTEQKLNKEEVIHFMSKQLQDLGYVGGNFESEVIERDSISSTAFGTFAIPHAMKMHEIRTGINIMIAKEPIDWDGKKVELVMMLCFNINERYLFNELFEPISMILVDPDNLAKVLKTKNADEFIDTLAELLP